MAQPVVGKLQDWRLALPPGPAHVTQLGCYLRHESVVCNASLWSLLHALVQEILCLAVPLWVYLELTLVIMELLRDVM